jgi:mannose-6-phosphate isomerase-like protein (cupin superfamily)
VFGLCVWEVAIRELIMGSVKGHERKETVMEPQRNGTVVAEEGRALWVLGELVTYKLASENSGGVCSLFEVVVQPQGGPPPHIQHREDEWTFVLEGEFELLNKGRIISCGPGSLVYVPKGDLHTYKNVGQDPGRLLVGQTPGGALQAFFEDVGEEAIDKSAPPVMDGPPDVERIVEIAASHGIEMPPPPEA